MLHGDIVVKEFELQLRNCVNFHTNTLRKVYTYLYPKLLSNHINIRPGKALTVIDWLSIISKSDISNKIKQDIFQTAVVSILLYGCTTWTPTKRIKKTLDGNSTRMLPVIMNKFWKQNPIKQLLYDHLPPLSKTI